jgi:hypothetical protein
MNPQVYTAIFGDTPLNDPAVVGSEGAGKVEPTAAPAGATAQEVLSSATQLRCIWRDPNADITYLEATVATVDTAIAATYLDGLPAGGYTCTEANGGRQCQLIKPNEQYPVDEGHTEFVRDAVYISVNQANFPTKNLLGAIVATLWK